MENLFYSKDEKILFYVAGYTDSSFLVTDIIYTMNDGVSTIEKLITKDGGSIDTRLIKTIFISNSSRYKQMRVFYVDTNIIPKDAFIIGGGENKWTMMQWLTS